MTLINWVYQLFPFLESQRPKKEGKEPTFTYPYYVLGNSVLTFKAPRNHLIIMATIWHRYHYV